MRQAGLLVVCQAQPPAGVHVGDQRRAAPPVTSPACAAALSGAPPSASPPCPQIMASHSAALPAGQLEVVELDQRPDGGAIQDALKAMT